MYYQGVWDTQSLEEKVGYNSKDHVFVSPRPKNATAQQISYLLGQEEALDQLIVMQRFSSTEVCPRFTLRRFERFRQRNGDHNLRGKTVNIIVTPSTEINRQDLWAQTLLIADAARYLGAEEVNMLSTELNYSRQDRGHFEGRHEQLRAIKKGNKNAVNKMEGQGVSAHTQALTLHAVGINKILTMHLHSDRIYDYFGEIYQTDPRKVLFDLNPMPVLAHYFITYEHPDSKVIIATPDLGAMKDGKVLANNIKRYSDYEVGTAFGKKVRLRPNDASSVHIEIVGYKNFLEMDVRGATIMCPDDIFDTCGTIQELTSKFEGARRVIVYGTHAILSGDGEVRLANSKNIHQVIVGGTYPLDRQFLPRLKEKMIGLEYAPFFKEGFLRCIVGGMPVDKAFKLQKPSDFMQLGQLYTIIQREGYVNHRTK